MATILLQPKTSQVTGTHTDFPVLVQPSLITGFGSLTLLQAQSIRAYTDATKATELPREVVSADEIWVKMPSLTTSSTLFLDWDGVRSDYGVTDTYGRNNVWTNYKGVWHLEDNTDSRGNGFNFTTNGSPTKGAAKIVNGVISDGANGNNLNYGSNVGFLSTGNWGMTFWVKPDSTTKGAYIAAVNKNSELRTLALIINTYTGGGSTLVYQAYFGNWSSAQANTNAAARIPSYGNWQMVHLMKESSTATLYINGVSVYTTSAGSDGGALTDTFRLLQNTNHTMAIASFNGSVDEARTYTTLPSANWITTEYNNQVANGDFWEERNFRKIFFSESFENGIPHNFNTVGNVWGDATAVLDTTSKMAGVNSLKMGATGEGSAVASYTLPEEMDEIYIQFKFRSEITAFSDNYTGLLALEDADGSIFYINIEDRNYPHLTAGGDTLGYTSLAALNNNTTYTIEIHFKRGSGSTGKVEMWINNTTEGSPTYTSGGTNTGTGNFTGVKLGNTYAPAAYTGNFWIDDVKMSTSFIGSASGELPDVLDEFTWQGYTWVRRPSISGGGPTYNSLWDGRNTEDPNVDNEVVLNITNPSGSLPYATEFYSKEGVGYNFGYGTYTVVTEGRFDNMHKSIVFGNMFLYDYHTPPHNQEIDIGEMSAWNSTSDPVTVSNGFYYDAGGGNEGQHSDYATMSSTTTQTHVLVWEPGKITITNYEGEGTSGAKLLDKVYTSDVIVPTGTEQVYFNLWVFGADGDGTPSSATPTQVTLKSFVYTPATTDNTGLLRRRLLVR